MTDQNQCFEPNGDDSIVIEQEDSAHFAPLISPQLFGILFPPPHLNENNQKLFAF